MIRRQRGGKLEAVSWDEALDYVATRLSAIKAKYGPDADPNHRLLPRHR